MTKTVFLDTNIFLHYEDFDRIDWLKVMKTEEVTIVISPVTIRELNKHKDAGSRARIKNRAGATLRKLYALFQTGNNARIQEGVEVRLEDRDPLIDFGAYQLSREVQDDHLIASMVMYQTQMPGADITLVTSDVGLTLMAKANRLRLNATKLDDGFKLPPEPDPDQQRIKSLEQELRALKLKLPQLSLAFEDGNQHATFNLMRPRDTTQEEFEKKLDDIKQRHPKLDSKPEQQMTSSGSASTIVKMLAELHKNPFFTVSHEDIIEYNAKLDEFYAIFAEYLQQEARFRNLEHRTIRLTIWIKNDGTAPGDDIDVFMHFPDGFLVVAEDDFPQAPQPPDPPSMPKTPMEKLSSFRTIANLPDLTGLSDVHLPPNISAPNIKRSNSYDVDLHVTRLKHGFQEPFGTLYVTFESIESARSFHVDYKILAADLPHEQSGRLHVIINRQE